MCNKISLSTIPGTRETDVCAPCFCKLLVVIIPLSQIEDKKIKIWYLSLFIVIPVRRVIEFVKKGHILIDNFR